jgi:hypothetical protein
METCTYYFVHKEFQSLGNSQLDSEKQYIRGGGVLLRKYIAVGKEFRIYEKYLI